jgi:sugar phosphate isomerase/epimerase
VEPRRRRRPGTRLHEHLSGDEAGLVLSALDRFSLPTFNWLRFPERQDPAPAWPLPDVLDGAAAAGFGRVGLDLFTVRAHLGGGHGLRDLGASLRARGLACSDVGVVAIGGAGARRSAEAVARLADAVGARICIAAIPAPVPRDVAVRQLETAAGIVARAGARVALEFASYGGLTRLADAVALCEAVGWERCGLLVDAWHFFRGGEPWSLLRSLDDDRVALVHVDDGRRAARADPVVDSRFRRLPPGAGEFALAAFAAALDDVGYRGSLSVEVLADEVRLQPPADGARLLMRSLRDAWPPPATAGATQPGPRAHARG